MSASGAGMGMSEWIGITVQSIPQLLVYIQVSCMYDSQFNNKTLKIHCYILFE